MFENRFVILKQLLLFYLYTFVLLIVHQYVMKIIIAGAGEVGFHLAKLLSFESQDIILIDTILVFRYWYWYDLLFYSLI